MLNIEKYIAEDPTRIIFKSNKGVTMADQNNNFMSQIPLIFPTLENMFGTRSCMANLWLLAAISLGMALTPHILYGAWTAFWCLLCNFETFMWMWFTIFVIFIIMVKILENSYGQATSSGSIPEARSQQRNSQPEPAANSAPE